MVRNERLVSVSALFRSILGKWRWMLLCAVLFGVLAAGYRAFKLYPRTKQQPAAAVESDVRQEASQAIHLDAELERIERALTEKNRYFEKSFYGQLNSVEVPKATATIVVTTSEMKEGEQLEVTYNDSSEGSEVLDTATRDANRILQFYIKAAENNVDWGELTEEFHTEPCYLNELVLVKSVHQDLVSADLAVVFIDEAGAKKLMDKVVEAMENMRGEALSTFGPHSFMVTNRYTTTNGTDKLYYNWMNDRLAEINNLCTQRDNLKNNMRLVRTSSAEAETTLSTRSLLISAGKFGVIGFIGGLLLFAIAYAVWLVLSDRVLSARELNRQYELHKLAAVPAEGGRKKGLDGLVGRIDGAYYSSTEASKAYQVASENIRNAADGKGRIALVGDLPAGLLEQLRLALKNSGEETALEYCPLAELNADASSLASLESCDAAVLAAKVGVSKYKHLSDLLGTVRAYGKPVLGSIVVD